MELLDYVFTFPLRPVRVSSFRKDDADPSEAIKPNKPPDRSSLLIPWKSRKSPKQFLAGL